MKRSEARKDFLRRHRAFLKEHPLAHELTSAERAFALSLAENHRDIKLYRSGSEIILSREAMHTPGVREPFVVKGKAKGRPAEDGQLETAAMLEAGNSEDLAAVLDEIHTMDWEIRDKVNELMRAGKQDEGFALQEHRNTLGELTMRIKQRCGYRPPTA